MPPPVPHVRKRPGCGCLLLVIIQTVIIALLAGTLLGRLSVEDYRKLHFGGPHFGADELPPLNEKWSEGRGNTKIVRIPLTGMIMLDDSARIWSTGGSASFALKSIRRATNDPEVLGLILEIDSGGGGITASDILYNALLEFKAADPRRRIVCIFGDVAASGAYYVALAGDRIIAHPTSITGSIGVLIQALNLRELAGKIGISDVTIKSGDHKDLLNPLRDIDPEQYAMLQEMVDQLNARFAGLVEKHRTIPEEARPLLNDGRIMLADQAVEAGLIDQIGYWKDARLAMAELLQKDDLVIFRYDEPMRLSGLLRRIEGFNPFTILQQPREARFLYYRGI